LLAADPRHCLIACRPQWRRYKRRNSNSARFKDEIMAIERTFSIIKPDGPRVI